MKDYTVWEFDPMADEFVSRGEFVFLKDARETLRSLSDLHVRVIVFNLGDPTIGQGRIIEFHQTAFSAACEPSGMEIAQREADEAAGENDPRDRVWGAPLP